MQRANEFRWRDHPISQPSAHATRKGWRRDRLLDCLLTGIHKDVLLLPASDRSQYKSSTCRIDDGAREHLMWESTWGALQSICRR
jgi:hypothetical protein